MFSRRDKSGRIVTRTGSVEVSEQPKSVVIPPDTDATPPYGIPIDATLAINLISDFQAMLSAPAIKTLMQVDPRDLADKRNGELAVKAVNTLVSILRRSCVITIDKNVMLKTLSQPGCEGLRFYLCKKTEEGEDYISLVTVGVDSEGRDLLYQPAAAGKKKSSASTLQDMSLISEYGHPPRGPMTAYKEVEDMYAADAFVLLHEALKMANENTGVRKTTKSKKRKGR